MTFEEILDQATALLQRRGRVSYRTLKLQFQLDDEQLAVLKEELTEVKELAVDKGGKMLVWSGETAQGEMANAVVSGQSSVASAPLPAPSTHSLSGERRQLTVMFCDLVGSTALSAQLDPEEWRDVVRAYQQVSAEVIARFEGYIAQYLGDGLLVYFGYPLAHEDDARRAVQTGLTLVEAIHELSLQNTQLQQPLQVRIGIHTGPVVVGEMGSGSRHEQLALGETPNLAARLQGQAESDTVVMSAATSHLVAGFFTSRSLGPQTLKGISPPVEVYQVLGESGAQSRFEVAVGTGLTPLVGRDLEVGLLRERWTQAKGGEGQVVLLSGEAGIGKSRLVQMLKEQVLAEGATRLEFRCSPYHQNSAFYPLIDHLQRLLQFHRDETPQAKLEKLRQTLVPYRFPQADTVPLLATLLSLPHPADTPALTLSPQKQKQKTQEILVAWLVEEAERQVVYCAWEDLHWADPSTLEFLTLFLDQVPTTRLLTLLTFRPDFTPPWPSRSHIAQLTLNRLGRPQVEMMVENVSGGKALPAAVLQQIVAKTDGVPLFVEELTKTVLESLESLGSMESLGSVIPATLQDSLMARLDRLGTAKEIAQLGATLGREFSYELIHAISPLDDGSLQHGLKQLVETELVYQRGLLPQAHYLFKHAFIQDTAYQSLLKSRRQQVHRQIAQVLEEQFSETKETQPELVAHHYTEAGLIEQAIPYWQQAGQRATQRSANAEAISHLTAALELLKTLPDTLERARQELALQTALGPALIVTKGFAAPAVEHVYARARELCRLAGETPQLFPVLWGLWAFYLVRTDYQTAQELVEQLLGLAQRVQDPALLVPAHRALGTTFYFRGEFAAAREHLETALVLSAPRQHRFLAFLYGEHPGVVCLCFAAHVLWYLGYTDQALQKSYEALALAREWAHPYSLAHALDFAAFLHYFRREAPLTQERAEAAMTLSAEQGFAFFLAMGTILRGWALAEQEQGEEGIAQMHQGLAASLSTGAEINRPYYLALLAEAYGKAGQAEEGLTMLAEALATVDKTGERLYEAELYRLKGQLTLQQFKVQSSRSKVPSPQAEVQAEAYFLKAIDLAQKQQAKSLELRAVMSLSRLWQQEGKQKEAHDLLSEIYNWFTEGFDTKDLQEAKALLDELA